MGIQEIHHKVRPYQVELIRRDYVANGGWETFLSYEDPEQDILIGLLRLRRCSPQSFRPELKGGVSIVRELHVYGSVVPVSSRDPSKFQHQVKTSYFHQLHMAATALTWFNINDVWCLSLHEGLIIKTLNLNMICKYNSVRYSSILVRLFASIYSYAPANRNFQELRYHFIYINDV